MLSSTGERLRRTQTHCLSWQGGRRAVKLWVLLCRYRSALSQWWDCASPSPMKKRQPRATLQPVLVRQRSRSLGARSPSLSRIREPFSGTLSCCHRHGEHAEQTLRDMRGAPARTERSWRWKSCTSVVVAWTCMPRPWWRAWSPKGARRFALFPRWPMSSCSGGIGWAVWGARTWRSKARGCIGRVMRVPLTDAAWKKGVLKWRPQRSERRSRPGLVLRARLEDDLGGRQAPHNVAPQRQHAGETLLSDTTWRVSRETSPH